MSAQSKFAESKLKSIFTKHTVERFYFVVCFNPSAVNLVNNEQSLHVTWVTNDNHLLQRLVQSRIYLHVLSREVEIV